MIYFISGHRDITEEEFNSTYVKKIKEVIKSDPDPWFVVGDYEGVDIMAQKFLDQIRLGPRVRVYHMFDSPRNIVQGLKTVGGFKSDEERDAAMTGVSDFDIAFYKKEKGNSGTFQNIARRWGILMIFGLFLISCDSNYRQPFLVEATYRDSMIRDTSFYVFPKPETIPIITETKDGVLRVSYITKYNNNSSQDNSGPIIGKGELIFYRSTKKEIKKLPDDSLYWTRTYKGPEQ